MTIRYLYLDDESEQSVKPVIDMLKRREPDLGIEYGFPAEFSEQIKAIKKNAYDGLILDLRLDQLSSGDKRKAGYGAYSLAQELRSRATEGRMHEFPIMLCSSELKLRVSLGKDNTSHDLFDDLYLKEELPDKSAMVAKRLVSLARGYQTIAALVGTKGVPFYKILSIDENFASMLDPRIFSRFGESSSRYPIHEYARFILTEMLTILGPLVSEEMVAARLGVNISSSSDWVKLKEQISTTKYAGPFADGWERWWWPKVEKWWQRLSPSERSLQLLPASKRVEILRKQTKLAGLEIANPVDVGYSECFWTLCSALARPLDPLDGFIVAGEEPRPWQERRYISIKAAVERTGYTEGLRVAPIERERLLRYKEAVKKSHGKA